MDAIEALKTRCSIRSYEDRPVPRELIEQVIDTARFAPSGRDTQPWEFVVVTDAAARKRIAELAPHGSFIAQSGACVAVFSRDVEFCREDGSAATENILVAARALGLGTCWVAGYKKPHSEPVAELLGAPEGVILIALVALGYPAERPGPRKKRALDEVLHWERF